jgi:hypothetical protein
MLPLLLLSAATFLPLPTQPLLTPRLFVCAFSRLFAFCALDVRFVLPIPVASSLLTSDTHPSFHLPIAAQTAPQECEFRSIMGLLSTTGKVFPANNFFAPFSVVESKALTPCFIRVKLQPGSVLLSVSCAVSSKIPVGGARVCSLHIARLHRSLQHHLLAGYLEAFEWLEKNLPATCTRKGH